MRRFDVRWSLMAVLVALAGIGAITQPKPAAGATVVDFDAPVAGDAVPAMPGVAGRAMMGAAPAPVFTPEAAPDAATDAATDAVLGRLTSDPRLKQAIHGLSSDIFNEMVKRTNGNPALMMKEIENAKRDPDGFAKTWSPEARAKLRSLAGQIDAPPTDPK